MFIKVDDKNLAENNIVSLQKTGDTPKQLLCHKEFLEHLHHLERNAPSLQQQCRMRIRMQLGHHPIEKIAKLPLPGSLKDYIALQDLR